MSGNSPSPALEANAKSERRGHVMPDGKHKRPPPSKYLLANEKSFPSLQRIIGLRGNWHCIAAPLHFKVEG